MTSRIKQTLLAAAWCLAPAQAQDEAKILRPTDRSAFSPGEISIVATAPAGKLELNGQALAAEEPFPNVLHAKVNLSGGEQTIALVWEGGRRQVRIFVGDNPPPEFQLFRPHPPVAVECTQCHGLSRRGRFRFTGGCFDCHEQEKFFAPHEHEPHVLEECGQCHNAHGSTTRSLLVFPRETACKLCHN